ncbi:UNVERIFIED_CONTAM: hypothetical protein PYX00_000710 [Menopon gallinae]|uniref:peptidylprolyl isomerase n=1 Tax=Menopon gallinae TaxID=328185 RepID=A0AAW2IA95_9NEOP
MPEVDVSDITPGSENVSDPATPNEYKDEDVDTDCATTTKGDSDSGDNKDIEEEEEWADIIGNGQLKMKVIRKGEPNTRPQPSDICEIKVVGTLESGRIVDKHDLLRIQLGDQEVIQGLELALGLMNVGEETIVIIAPRFAYGKIGNPPDIPPNATITYNLKLLRVELEPDLEEIPYNVRKAMACAKRERGNWWYARQDATKAVQCYRKALEILNETVPYKDENGKAVESSQEMITDIIEHKMKVYNNLAAAQLMLEAYDTALSSVNEVIKYDPNNVKALFRKSKILSAKGCVNEAVETLRQAYLLEPENTAVKMELSRCVKQQQIEKQHEKNLYKKMLGHNSRDDIADRSKARSSKWTKVLGTAATATLMAAIAVAISYKFKNCPFL